SPGRSQIEYLSEREIKALSAVLRALVAPASDPPTHYELRTHVRFSSGMPTADCGAAAPRIWLVGTPSTSGLPGSSGALDPACAAGTLPCISESLSRKARKWARTTGQNLAL